jgi:hypothetical protein
MLYANQTGNSGINCKKTFIFANFRFTFFANISSHFRFTPIGDDQDKIYIAIVQHNLYLVFHKLRATNDMVG